MSKSKRRVVIIGGGYAGVRAAHDLAWADAIDKLEIVLIAQSSWHLEVPALYEVATAYLPHESSQSSEYICQGIGVPLVDLFQTLPVSVRIGEVRQIDMGQRLIMMSDQQTLSFDWLVLTVGSQLANTRVPGAEEYGFTLKTISEALRLRHHIVRTTLTAPRQSGEVRQAALTYVVVGGGSSGIETATELVGLLRHLWQRPQLRRLQPKVILVEAGQAMARDLPEASRRKIQQRLQRLGIEVRVGQPVTAVEADRVVFGNGARLPTRTVIWTAGLRPAVLLTQTGFPLYAWGVEVMPTLQVKGQVMVFAAGDCAILKDLTTPLPATMPVALAQGRLVARNIMHQLRRQPLEEFSYDRKGYIITVGGRSALQIFSNGRGMLGLFPWLSKRISFLGYWLRYLPFWRAVSFWWQGVRVQQQND